MKSQKKIISLFCGCGGFDAGFRERGYHTIAGFDIDTAVLDVFNNNGCGKGIQAKIGEDDISFDEFKNADVMLSGSPCQGFSNAGKRRLKDPRNALMIQAGKIAAQLKPTVFIAENVKGAIAGKHRRYWEKLKDILVGAGYRCCDQLVNCQHLGMAQMRERVVLLAWRNNKDISFVVPQISPQSLKEALSGINDESPNHDPHFLVKGTDDWKIACKILPGQKLSNVRGGAKAVHTWEIPSVFGHTTKNEQRLLESIRIFRRRFRIRDIGDADPVSLELLQPLFNDVDGLINSLIEKGFIRFMDGRVDLTNTFNGKYRRLEWDKLSFTVDTRFGNPNYFLHPDGHRGFTVREAARIQGFKDSFTFSGSSQAQFRMIGNAVPPPLAEYLATVTDQILD